MPTIRGLLSDLNNTMNVAYPPLAALNAARKVMPNITMSGLLGGTVDSAKKAYTAPIRAMRGEFDADSPQAYEEALNLAGMIGEGGLALSSAVAPVGKGTLGHTVWHGSPHKFDKFDMSKIGTGEGAQAYGHGLYFAESPEVGKEYARIALTGPANVAHKVESAGGDPIARLKTMYPNMPNSWYESAVSRGRQEANLYKVDIPDEILPRMLDWDKPLSQQTPEVQAALLKSGDSTISNAINDVPVAVNGGDYWKYRGNTYASKREALEDATGFDITSGRTGLGNSPAEVSEKLKALGIPGIRYLDGGSRSAGKGSYNFVLFDDNLPRILERNGVPTGQIPWKDDPISLRGLLK